MAMRDPDDLQQDHDLTTEEEKLEGGVKEMPSLHVEENSKGKIYSYITVSNPSLSSLPKHKKLILFPLG